MTSCVLDCDGAGSITNVVAGKGNATAAAAIAEVLFRLVIELPTQASLACHGDVTCDTYQRMLQDNHCHDH
jgi:hypothetical protein